VNHKEDKFVLLNAIYMKLLTFCNGNEFIRGKNVA